MTPTDKLAEEIYRLMNKPTVHADSVAVAKFILARESQIRQELNSDMEQMKSDIARLESAISKFKGE